MAITGAAERSFVMGTSGIGGLAGGRVYKTQVPDNVDLTKNADGTIKPYIVVFFRRPFHSEQGRSVAGGEQKQPHIMSFTVAAYARSADEAEAVIDQVVLKLVGARPSDTAGEIQMVGGFTSDNSDNDSKPIRYAAWAFFRVPINL